MSQPPDKITFDLVPNDDADDPRITRAVEAAIRRHAEQQGLKVTEPGAIDPAAKENPDRAEKIKNETRPKLLEYSCAERGVELAEERRPNGRIHRRIKRIGERTRRLSIDITALATLTKSIVDFLKESKDSLIELATKVGKYIGNCVGSRTEHSKKTEVLLGDDVEVSDDRVLGEMNLNLKVGEVKGKAYAPRPTIQRHSTDILPPKE